MTAKATFGRQEHQSQKLHSAELHLEQPASTSGCQSILTTHLRARCIDWQEKVLRSQAPADAMHCNTSLQSAAPLVQHEHIGGKLASKLVGCHRELAAAPCQSPLTIHMVHTAYPKLDPATRQCSGAHPAHTQPCAGNTNHSCSLPRAHPMQAWLTQRY